ncbi:MAG TPA: PEP-CTERM sorting domain-containing protein, partial [Tepidisphaeraceae bacterium]|nr:PEP-CTERM sorting domain-containing protein [Tepidisphaeraceae bacterium]
LIYGIEMVSPIIDRVNVTGELDLTNASIHPESVAQVWSSNVPNFDHFVIATYGNRIGSFPQTTVTYSDWLPIQFEMPIHYTSPENSGPGEVWLVVPEPTSIALVALMVPIALRRRHRKPA